MSATPSPWRRRVVLTLLGLVAGGLVLLVVGTARLFVWPPTDQPTRADAVVALGGDPGQLRAKQALHLARLGYAPVAVISLGGQSAVACPRPVAGVRLICFRADPLDTAGEAEYVAHLAARRHWQSPPRHGHRREPGQPRPIPSGGRPTRPRPSGAPARNW